MEFRNFLDFSIIHTHVHYFQVGAGVLIVAVGITIDAVGAKHCFVCWKSDAGSDKQKTPKNELTFEHRRAERVLLAARVVHVSGHQRLRHFVHIDVRLVDIFVQILRNKTKLAFNLTISRNRPKYGSIVRSLTCLTRGMRSLSDNGSDLAAMVV